MSCLVFYFHPLVEHPLLSPAWNTYYNGGCQVVIFLIPSHHDDRWNSTIKQRFSFSSSHFIILLPISKLIHVFLLFILCLIFSLLRLLISLLKLSQIWPGRALSADSCVLLTHPCHSQSISLPPGQQNGSAHLALLLPQH